ncbi:hypothetical protein [Myxococcus sp. AB036A]|uniref:hypothetical protein n=1 Tax=Myxococcus sp. AB036A TaxID=2562793 RepID=UPI001146C7FD|nr:hypothetical protein [Myxococcus sp. AB036A]
MKRQLKQGALALIVILPIAVMARSFPASGGRPVSWEDGECFRMSGSAMYNNCTTQRRYEFALTIDGAGSKTVLVTAYGATSSNNVGCAVAGVNREGTLAWGGTRKWLPGFGSRQIITLTDGYMPSGGYMYLNCQVDPGGMLVAVDHTP